MLMRKYTCNMGRTGVAWMREPTRLVAWVTQRTRLTVGRTIRHNIKLLPLRQYKRNVDSKTFKE